MGEKFKYNSNLVNVQARENIKGLVKIVLVLKCYCRMNHYSKRDREINREITSSEYLR